MDYFARRRDLLRRALGEEQLDALLVSAPANVSYLTNFSGESSYLVLTRDRALLVSDFRFVEQIAEECPGLEAYIRPPSQYLPQATAHVLGGLGLRTLGFESSHLTVGEFAFLRDATGTLDWKGGGQRVELLRAQKDDSEVAEIREAIGIAERAFAAFRALLRPDDREKDLVDTMDHYIRRAGGRCTSFPSIIAVGRRAALPHAPPTNRPIASEELLLVDWGASGRFYKSDLTRTLATRKISPKFEAVYGVVLDAQQRAIRVMRPGVTAQAVDAEARAVIAQAGFGEFFGHGLGHGLGIQVHEAPLMRPGADVILRPGMVLTVEPGIYLPDWGGVRIEDDVLITPDGCEVLTRVPRDLDSAVLWEG